MNMPNERVFAIDANHIEMNKFVNKVDPNYRQIVLILRETLSEVRDSGKFGKLSNQLDVCPLMAYSCSRGGKRTSGSYREHRRYMEAPVKIFVALLMLY